jgi:hypothetical protein
MMHKQSMMTKIKEFLFGRLATPVCERPKAGHVTTCHGQFTTFGDWCKEFNVSMLHDRKSIHLN